MDIQGAVAFVTGASGGLGACIAKALARDGVKVALGYRRGADRAAELCHEIEAQGGAALTVPLEQSEPASIEAAISEVTSQFGRLDIVINNAGMATGGHDIAPGDLAAFTPEIWDELMAVNMRGPYLLARAAAPHLRASAWGRIVNIGSTIGHGDWYADRIFAPSKASVIPLTRFLAASLAPDVTVNCVSPGLMVETGLGSGAPSEIYDRWTDRAAMGVTTSLDDVAGQVAQICKSPSMTGQTIVIDGGIHFG